MYRDAQARTSAVFPVVFPPLGIAKLIRKTQWALSLRLRYRPDDDEESRAGRVNPTEITFVQLLFLVLYIILLLCIVHRFRYTYVHYNSVASSALVKYAIVVYYILVLYILYLRTQEQYIHIYTIKFTSPIKSGAGW